MRFAILSALCLWSGLAFGQVPTPFVVSLEGPADGTGGFMVFVTKPSLGIARWNNTLPAGAAFAELTDNTGRTVLVFLNPKPGRYELALSVQLPTGVTKDNPTGLDPFADDSLIVQVGGVPTPPPGPTPPDPPTPPIPDDTTKISHANFVLLDSWSGRAASPALRTLGPESRQWAAIRAAGHRVVNFDVEGTIARAVYPGYAQQAPMLLIFDRDKQDKFVRAVKVASIADVEKAYRETTGKDVP